MGLEVETVAEWQRGKKSGLSQWGGRKSEEETLTLKEASLYSRPKQVIRQQFIYPFNQLGEHEIIKPTRVILQNQSASLGQTWAW